MIRHWDDVEPVRRERGHIGGEWQGLTGGDTLQTGVSRVRVDPADPLRAYVAATGHGKPMFGEEMRRQLDALADRFLAGAAALPALNRSISPS